MGAGRVRCHALLAGAGLANARPGHEQDHRENAGNLTLLASGIGGILCGFLADRIGRKRALMASILTYSICAFASGLATSIAMLAGARFVLGLGMGGERNTGATLVAESWPKGKDWESSGVHRFFLSLPGSS
jgi:MFS family permease